MRDHTISVKNDKYIINDRWEIYKKDGCVYDTKKAKDIPQWIFKIRDILLKGSQDEVL